MPSDPAFRPDPGLKVLDARFVTSATDVRTIPNDGIPHVALVGRSNVGKSTLINAVARVRVARTSAAPGKTRLVNLYRFALDGGPGGPGRWTVHLVDLPGYGYARGGQAAVRELAAIAEAYFSDGRTPDTGDRSDAAVRPPYIVAGVLHLIDARHPDLDADKQAADWLATLGVERALVATKIDKLSRAERAKNLGHLERKLGMPALPISAMGGEGLDDLWKLIAKLSRQR